MKILHAADRALATLLRWLTVALFIVLGLLLLANVALRLVNDLTIFLSAHGLETLAAGVKALAPLVSFHWFDEIVELCFASLVFYGAAALWRVKGHFSVGDWISSRLPGDGLRVLYKTCISLFNVVFMAVLFWYSLLLTTRATELSTVFQIPKSVMYSCMPIASLIMLVYSLAEMVGDLRALADGRKTARGQGSQSL